MPQLTKSGILIFFRLIKITVTAPVTFLSLAGYILYGGNISKDLLLTAAGVFFLVCASSVLNQVIEQKSDALMERTKHRPVPSGQITIYGAVYFSVVLIALGSLSLFLVSYLCLFLGLVNMVWYLAVYTPLKKVTSFAVVPGSLIGSITVFIGWVAAGGEINDPPAIIIAAFVFIWQIPHFWLLMLVYGEQYEKAGLPTILRLFQFTQVRLWTLGWIVAACIVTLPIPIFLDTKTHFILYPILLIQTLLIILSGIILLIKFEPGNLRKLFHSINIFLMLFLGLLVLDKLLK
jgi:heme o synthase